MASLNALTASELITAIAAALAADTTLIAWCDAQFGTDLVIYEGAPDEADAPCIAILGVSGNSRSDGGTEIIKQVVLGVSVENSEVVTDGYRRTHTGLHQVETMRELAEDAIFRARLGAVAADFVAEPDAHPPLYISYTAIEHRSLKTTRRRLPG
jgi:hypothetical protein